MSIISIKNLNKTYKERDIFKKLKGQKFKIGVKDVNFNIEEGEIFSIIGLNGAGKTTIMKCLLGLLDYDSGDINILGEKKLTEKIKTQIGYLPEISYYPKSISLEVLMEYYAELYGIKNKEEKIVNALEKVGLISRRKSKLEDFSKGMLQKVGIAQAILNSPKLLFLDEPMSGLDPLARFEVIKLIKELKEKGTTIILNTHILNDIETIGNRGIVVNKGKVVDSFDLNSLRKEATYTVHYKNGIEKNISKSALDSKLKELEEISDIIKEKFSLEEYFKNIVLGGEKWKKVLP